MSIAFQPMTADELLALPRGRGERHELIRGELITMAPSGYNHSNVNAKLSGRLTLYILEHDLGEPLSAEAGFILSRSPDTVRAPDFAFIRRARVPKGTSIDKFFTGHPDLAVEVVSPNDSAKYVREKAEEWIASGTQLVWVVDPKRKAVTEYRPGATPKKLSIEDELQADDLLPGFRLPVKTVFE